MPFRYVVLLLCCWLTSPLHASPVQVSYTFAQLGTPKYAVDFHHYDYVNPDAPKGGKIVQAVPGTYDNFNR